MNIGKTKEVFENMLLSYFQKHNILKLSLIATAQYPTKT